MKRGAEAMNQTALKKFLMKVPLRWRMLKLKYRRSYEAILQDIIDKEGGQTRMTPHRTLCNSQEKKPLRFSDRNILSP